MRPSLPASTSWIFALAAVAACTQSNGVDVGRATADAERARELKLLTPPPIVEITRAEYTAEAERRAAEETDDSVRTEVDAFGRVGFFPLTFDVRGSAGESSAQFSASYSARTKSITLVGNARHSTLVHELVHALQDQHFDLTRLDDTAISTDEAFAKRALVEGDAVIAEYRVDLWGRGDDLWGSTGEDPTKTIARFITPEYAAETSDKVLAGSKLPLIFAAYAAFAYSYGAAYVTHQLGLTLGSWTYARVNDLMGASGPASTQQVMRATQEADPILATGLGTLPAQIANEYAVELVDRLGEWHTYLLLFKTIEAAKLKPLAATWDGDQLLLLRKKDGASPPSKTGRSAIVWTSIWDTEEAAHAIHDGLVELHTGQPPTTGDVTTGHELVALDGESIWVEQRGNQVCFVKNLDGVQMELLARVALSTRDEKRLEILRAFAATPLAH